MSHSEVERFITDIRSGTSLQEKVKAAGADQAAVVKIAHDKGYDFSADELTAYVKAKKAELSEEQLEKVAGGDAEYPYTLPWP